MKWFRKLLLPALNRPRTATLISSCAIEVRALASRPDRAEISYLAAMSDASSSAGCNAEWARLGVIRPMEYGKWAGGLRQGVGL